MQVFTNQAANGNSLLFAPSVPRLFTRFANIYVSGDMGGGTITIEAELPDASDFVTVSTSLSITATGMYILETGPFVGRLVLSGATTPDIDAWVEFEGDSVRDKIEAGRF